MYQQKDRLPETEGLPTMYDLPSEDPEEPGLPDLFHDWQPNILSQTCRPPNIPLSEVFVASDINIYYDPHHPYRFKRPDWFVVIGRQRPTRTEDMPLSYVIWQEKIAPLVVVELLSPSTREEDLGLTKSQPGEPPTKWEVYERILKIPYYVVFSRLEGEMRVFRLVRNRYREQVLSQQRFWIPELELGIGVHLTSDQGTDGLCLRWYDADGNWIPTAEEQAQQERLAKEEAQEQAKEAQEQAKEAQERAERLAARLRELGIDPDEL